MAHLLVHACVQASSVYLEKQMIPNLRSLIQKAETAPKAKKGVPSPQPPKVSTHPNEPSLVRLKPCKRPLSNGVIGSGNSGHKCGNSQNSSICYCEAIEQHLVNLPDLALTLPLFKGR